MIGLKAGNRVQHRDGTLGHIECVRTNGDYKVIPDGKLSTVNWYEYNTSLCPTEFKYPEKNIPTNSENTSYSFHSTCLIDVDFDMIRDELTHKNPLALVSVGERRFVVVHKALKAKASLCGIGFNGKPLDRTKQVFETIAQFSSWISWAKEVKSAQWPKSYRKKETVTVTHPTI